jgi:hypothetical protein
MICSLFGGRLRAWVKCEINAGINGMEAIILAVRCWKTIGDLALGIISLANNHILTINMISHIIGVMKIISKNSD